jgi:hypothetical protein
MMERIKTVIPALTLALCAVSDSRAAVVRTFSAPVAPLTQLGAVLSGLPLQTFSVSPGAETLMPPALAPLSSLSMPVPVVSASLHDPARAAVLVERGAALAALPVAVNPEEPVSAVKTLEAVNSVLKDFSPNDLRSMPEEKLNRLAGLVMDQAAGRRGADDAEAIAALAEANLRKIDRLRAAPMREKIINPGHPDSHADMIDVEGIPERVKTVPHDGVVYRHYTTADGLMSILDSGGLWNGFMPYVEMARGVYKKTFKDLTGVFLTVPGVPGDHVGVPADTFTHYVDVVVPKNLPLLEVEKGGIYLIPLPGRTRSWFVDIFRRWAGGGDAGMYEASVKQLDAAGGLGPDLVLPLIVVDYGEVGAPGRIAQLLASARKTTQKSVSVLLEKKEAGVEVAKTLANTDTKTITEYSGVPSRIERLETTGKTFRHWTKDEATFKAIVRTGILKAGPTPYVDFTGGRGAFIKDIYPDLKGVFFTMPTRSAGEPRVMNRELPYYIDFRIPEGVASLRLDGDDVLLIPAEPGAEIPVMIVGTSPEPAQ